MLESTNLPGSLESPQSGSSDAAGEDNPLGASLEEGAGQGQGSESEGAPADAGTAEVVNLRQQNAELDAKYTRSRQEIANYKQRLVELDPYIQIGLKASSDPQQLARLRENAAANPTSQGAAAAVAAAETGRQAGMDPQTFLRSIDEIVQKRVAETWDQKNFDTRQMDRLHKRASKELDGFDKMSEHPAYIALVNHAIYLQNEGTLEQQGDDSTYSAMDYAHKMFLSTNPKYMAAVKETGKKEALDKAEKKAEANAAGGTSRSAEAETGGGRKLSAEEQERFNILKAYRGGRRELPHGRR